MREYGASSGDAHRLSHSFGLALKSALVRFSPIKSVWINIYDLVGDPVRIAEFVNGLFATLPRIVVIDNDEATLGDFPVEIVQGIHG